jgi:hypothetical protein
MASEIVYLSGLTIRCSGPGMRGDLQVWMYYGDSWGASGDSDPGR